MQIFPAHLETKFMKLKCHSHLRREILFVHGHVTITFFQMYRWLTSFFFFKENVFNYFVAFLLWKICCPKLIVTFNIVRERFCQWWYYFHIALLPQEDYKMLLNCQTVYMHIQLKFPFCGFINICTHSISIHWTLRDSSWMVKPCFPLKCIKGNPTVGQDYNFLAQSSGEHFLMYVR